MVNKKGLVVKTSLGLIYILPYYFYSFHVIHNIYLTKIIVYLFINICHIPITFMINKAKKHFSLVICVYCKYLALKYFFPRMVVSSVSQVVPKNILLSPTMFSQFQENVSSLNFLANALLSVNFIL